MESKPVDAESAKVAEMHEKIESSERNSQSGLRRNQEIPSGFCCGRGESMDKNRSHVLSPESLEEVRNFEQ